MVVCKDIISLHYGCEVKIENSVTRVTVQHHEAYRVMPNSYPSDGILNSHRRTIMDSFSCIHLLHMEGRLPVLLCAVKTVEGDFRFCWTITPNVGQTHKENPNLVRMLYMACTLNDIYKQYNKLHEHWFTKISSLRGVADRNAPQNASDLYTKYWSYAEHCRPCTRLSGVNWWKQKQITLIVPIGYSLFADHRSVPSSGPGFLLLIFAH